MFSGKKLLLFGLLIVLLVAVPLTVYLAQQQQQTQSKAAPSTTLSICASPSTTTCNPITATAGQKFSVDVMMTPGSNLVSYANLDISYDSAKIIATPSGTVCTTNSVCPNATAFPATLQGPSGSSGTISLSLSIGADPTKVIQTTTKVATITFEVLPSASGTTDILFGNQTQVLSANTAADQPDENVLSTANKGTVTITAAAAPTPTLTPTPGPLGVNRAPVCTALNIDRAATGPAPFSITFTVIGTDSDGTINKATFNFGDGPVQDVTQSGGIGTNSVNAQVAHTYQNANTYTATAILTDNGNAASAASAACAKTIIVTAASGSAQIVTAVATATPFPPTPTATPLPRKVFTEPPGPGNAILGIGALGALFSIIGGLIFFSL